MMLRPLLDRVVDEYPSVPEVIALRALADAAKEFCNRTHIWREQLVNPLQVTNSAKFVVALGEGRVVASLLAVRVDGRRMEPVPVHDRRMQRTAGTEPRVYTQWSPSMFELDVAPPASAVVVVHAALSLAADAVDADLPDDLIDEYGKDIAAGAKMILVRQVGQAWANPDAAVGYGGEFYNAIASAKRRTMTALGQAEVRVQMREWV